MCSIVVVIGRTHRYESSQHSQIMTDCMISVTNAYMNAY